ncbi:MAG: DUF3501 family protein, partial [Nitrospirota bacterium]
MKPLTVQDVLPIEEYERLREAFRRRIIDLKQRRRLSVGNLVTVVFENRETVLFQIQEMVRAERILRPERVSEEVAMYNEQIPLAGELSATLMIEVTDPQLVKPVLDRLQGIDRGQTVGIRVGPHLVYGVFEQGRSNEEKISAVHYVRFPVPEAVKALMEDPA